MGTSFNVEVLRTFQAVARLGRFKDAAEYVHRSPSAVTAQIQKLEEQVGQQLLLRSNQSVTLTPAGQQLLNEATRFLLAHDRLQATLSPQKMIGKVRLGVPEGYAANVMNDLLPAVAASQPNLALDVVVRSSAELMVLFARQQLDLAVVVSREALAQGERLGATQPRWASAPGFRHDPRVPLPLALPLKGCPYREMALEALKTQGIAHRVLLESANWQAVRACMESGVAVGIVERLDTAQTPLVSVKGMHLPRLPHHHVYLLANPDQPVAPPLQALMVSTLRLFRG